MNNITSYSYDDIGIIPRRKSDISSRSIVNLETNIFNKTKLKVPIVASPMDTVCDGDMAIYMNSIGAVGIIHRFQTIGRQVSELRYALDEIQTYSTNDHNNIGIAIGVTGDYQERFISLYNTYVSHELASETTLWVCFDTANGFTQLMENAVMWLKEFSSFNDTTKIVTMAGNISSKEGYRFLCDIGIDVVRVGIGSGSACSTSAATGVGVGIISVLDEIFNFKKRYDHNIMPLPLIMVDGGIRSSGDVVKSIAMGADLVMLGRLLAGFKESPGEIIIGQENWKYNGKIVGRGHVFTETNSFSNTTKEISFSETQLQYLPKYKRFRGLASPSASKISKKLNNTNKFKNVEGIETIIPYKENISDFINDFIYGIKSGFSYVGAVDISQFREYFNLYTDSIVLLSQNAIIEKQPKYHKE